MTTSSPITDTTQRMCRPIGEHTTCGVSYDEHRLRDGRLLHPVLSDRGYWVEPPLECVADTSVAHDGDDVEACGDCMRRIG